MYVYVCACVVCQVHDDNNDDDVVVVVALVDVSWPVVSYCYYCGPFLCFLLFLLQ